MDDNASVDSKTSSKTYSIKSRTFRIPSHSDSILDILNLQRERGEYCDITVLVEHQRFTAHKCVLAASSPYFDTLLSSDNDGLYLRQVSVDSFRTILDFMYTSKLQLEPGKIQDILSAAKFLQVKGVVSICCRYLETQIKALAKNIQSDPEHGSSPAAVLSVEPNGNIPAPRQSFLSPMQVQNPPQHMMRRQPDYLPQVDVGGAPMPDLSSSYNFNPAHRNNDSQRYIPTFPNVAPSKEIFSTNPPSQFQINPFTDQRLSNFQQMNRVPRRTEARNFNDGRNQNYDQPRRHHPNPDGRVSHWNPNFGVGTHNVSSPKTQSKSADVWDRKRGERNLLLSQPTARNSSRLESSQFPPISHAGNGKTLHPTFGPRETDFATPSLIHNSPAPRYQSNNHGRISSSKKFLIEQTQSPSGFATISY